MRPRNRILQDTVWLAAFSFLTLPASAQTQAPRLTVVVVAEQFRADYLSNPQVEFAEGGFRRMIESGTFVRRSRFDYVATLAAPGAATLATGAWPSGHGIIANSWFDSESGDLVDSVGDPANPSAAALIGSTFADELTLASEGRSKVIAISGDPAPGVLLAGRKPTGCYWRGANGQFRTSASFAREAPDWVRKFNEEQPALGGGPLRWVALGAEPGAPPLRVMQGEAFATLYRASPFAVEGAFDFAKAAVMNERLGAREFPDLLILNLSATARLALETGAHSPLMRDLVARIDRSLASFVDWLDESIGLEDVTIIFTGAHGAPPQAVELIRSGLSLRRVSGARIVQRVTEALESAPSPRFSVQKYVYPFLYLDVSTRLATLADRDRARGLAAEAALQVRGVNVAYSGAGEGPFARSSYPGRSGDVILGYEPFTVEEYGESRGVSPGSRHRYDTDVPLLMLGRRIRRMTIERDIPATTVAPTIAALLNVAAPSGALDSPLTAALAPAPEND